MKQCETCILKEHKNELFCCAAAHLGEAVNTLKNEVKRELPIFKQNFPDYECCWYIGDDE